MLKSQQKLVVRKLTTNFREAVSIENGDVCHPKEGEVCIKNKYVGVIADDINVTKGRPYFVHENIPFGTGLEGVGQVVSIGPGVTDIKVGDAVAYFSLDHCAFSEYTCAPIDYVFRVPEVIPEYLVLLCGVTAHLGLEKLGNIKKGETVLITAAAGGLGHLAVQIAKSKDCFVIGTCSSKEKEELLKDIGCDRVINYKKENLGDILSKEFPNGVDVIWETVGKPVFDICLQNIAEKGRLLVMGATSEYQTESGDTFNRTNASSLIEAIFYKGASIIGGNIDTVKECFQESQKRLLELFHQGKIRPVYDLGNQDEQFVGLEGIIRAVEYLFSGRSIGKVIAKIY